MSEETSEWISENRLVALQDCQDFPCHTMLAWIFTCKGAWKGRDMNSCEERASKRSRQIWVRQALRPEITSPTLRDILTAKISDTCNSLFKNKIYFLCMSICLCACMHVHTYVPVVSRGQKRTLDSRKLELQMVRTSILLLGTKPGYSAKSATVLKHWATSVGPTCNSWKEVKVKTSPVPVALRSQNRVEKAFSSRDSTRSKSLLFLLYLRLMSFNTVCE